MNKQIDRKKRQTLKGIATVAGATALGSLPAIATAVDSTVTAQSGTGKVRQVWPPLANKTPIEVTPASNGLLITNKAKSPINMSQARTANGSINLSDAVNAPVHLAAGDSLHIPVTSKAQTGISILSDANEFSAVSYAVA